MIFWNKTNLLRLILLSFISFIFSCKIEQVILQSSERKGQPFDVNQDTIFTRHFTAKNKIAKEEYRLNNKLIFSIDFEYFKDGGWLEIRNDGLAMKFFPSGKIQATTFVKKYLTQDMNYTFYENGNRHCVCSYSDGIRQGQSAIYWENGQLFTRSEYRKGLLWTIFERYHADGQAQDFGNLKDGTGIEKEYDDNKILVKINHYKNGKVVKEEVINSSKKNESESK